MLRDAKRPLAGAVGWGESEVILGRYTTSEYDGFVYDRRTGKREDIRGVPAVTVNPNGGRSGTRTFTEPAELEKFARELIDAAMWLRAQRGAGQ